MSSLHYSALLLLLVPVTNVVACDSGESAARGESGGAGGSAGDTAGSAGDVQGATGGTLARGGSVNAGGSGSPNGGTAGASGSGGVSAQGGTAAGGAQAGSSGENSSGGTAGSVDPTGGTDASGGTAGTGAAPNEPISAVDAAASMGRGFNLGQMFENSQHPATLAAAGPKIDAYYDRGFRLVRVPVTWTEHAQGDLLVNDANVGDVDRAHPRLQALAQVIDYALSKPDLFVVVNAHHEKALKTEGRSAVLERLWSDIADIFQDRDYRLIFEILNEPHRDDSSAMPPETLRDMTGKAYAKIRAVDAERLVVIGGNQWFGAAEMAATWPNLDAVGGGQDAFVMATFHHYDPWTFCGDNQGTYDDPWTEANLSDPMDTMLAWSESVGNGMPIFIGEWGVGWGSRYDTMDCNNIRLWYEGLHSDHAEPKGMPTAVWDDGGWFKLFDHGTNEYDNDLILCITAGCEWTDSARFNVGCL